MSGVAVTSAIRKPKCRATRPWPVGWRTRRAGVPSRAALSAQRTAELGLTANRAAAARRGIPAAIAAVTRSRRSCEYAMAHLRPW
jgi:hypothetical protein